MQNEQRKFETITKYIILTKIEAMGSYSTVTAVVAKPLGVAYNWGSVWRCRKRKEQARVCTNDESLQCLDLHVHVRVYVCLRFVGEAFEGG